MFRHTPRVSREGNPEGVAVEPLRARLRHPLFGVWRSLVARFVRDEEVAGSNPVTPTGLLHVWPSQTGFSMNGRFVENEQVIIKSSKTTASRAWICRAARLVRVVSGRQKTRWQTHRWARWSAGAGAHRAGKPTPKSKRLNVKVRLCLHDRGNRRAHQRTPSAVELAQTAEAKGGVEGKARAPGWREH